MRELYHLFFIRQSAVELVMMNCFVLMANTTCQSVQAPFGEHHRDNCYGRAVLRGLRIRSSADNLIVPMSYRQTEWYNDEYQITSAPARFSWM